MNQNKPGTYKGHSLLNPGFCYIVPCGIYGASPGKGQGWLSATPNQMMHKFLTNKIPEDFTLLTRKTGCTILPPNQTAPQFFFQ